MEKISMNFKKATHNEKREFIGDFSCYKSYVRIWVNTIYLGKDYFDDDMFTMLSRYNGYRFKATLTDNYVILNLLLRDDTSTNENFILPL